MVTPDMNAVVNAVRAPVYRMSLSALLRGYARKQIEVSWFGRLPTVRCKKALSFKVATGSSQLVRIQ